MPMKRSTSMSPITQMLFLLVATAWSGCIWHGVEGFQTPRTGVVVSTKTNINHRGRSSCPSRISSARWAGNDDKETTPNYFDETKDMIVGDSKNIRYEPIFDFSGPDRADVVAKFDRIDDAIMGGISTSSLRVSASSSSSSAADDDGYAIWSGVCRTDGGGFCGTRTLPFQDGVPLKVVDDDDSSSNRDGFYLTVRLASDNEPERRVWKLTTRVENVQTSEQVYQTDFVVPPQDATEGGLFEADQWKTIVVPFENFVQVRGPRIVPNGPPLDVSEGLYQVGMTMSKFRISNNATELVDFRPGYFELQIKDIGLYTTTAAEVAAAATTEPSPAAPKTTSVDVPVTVTKEEAQRNRPLALKVLLPIAKLFFSEQRNRRKSATRILKERWGLNRWGVASFGFRRRASSQGLVVTLARSLVEAVAGATRLVAFWTLKIALFYPLLAIRRTIRTLTKKRPQQAPQAE